MYRIYLFAWDDSESPDAIYSFDVFDQAKKWLDNFKFWNNEEARVNVFGLEGQIEDYRGFFKL